MKRIFLLLSMLLLIGCMPEVAYNPVQVDEQVAPSADVYVFRDMTYFATPLIGKPDPWVVAVDDHHVAKLNMGEFTKFKIGAGASRDIQIKRWDVWWQTSEYPKVIQPGETYYFLVGVESLQKMFVKMLTKEEAQAWMERNSYIEPVIK